MSKSGLSLVLWLLLASIAQGQTAQVPAWPKTMLVGQAKGAGIKLESIAADTLGNVYVTGSFAGTARFGSTTLTAGAGGLTFVAKWNDAAQRYCWAVPVAAASVVAFYHLATSGGAVYATGSYERPVRLANTMLPATGGACFIAKLIDKGTTGQLVWVQPILDVSGEGARLKTLAVQGTAVYVAGDFSDTVRLGSSTLRTTGNRSLFVAKLTDTGSQGHFVWARQTGGSGVVTNPTLAVTGTRVYITGGFVGTVTMGDDSLAIPKQKTGMLVARLLDTGPAATISWLKHLEIGEGYLDAMAAAGDSLYIAGQITYGVQMHKTDNYPTTLQSLFIAKLKDEGTAGRLVWKSQFDNALPTDNVNVMDMALRGSALYLAGQVSGIASFGLVQLHAAGRSDVFLAQAHESPAGAAFDWVQRLGGGGRVSVTSNALGLLAIASTGTLYLGATLGPAATIGPQPVLPNPAATFADYLVLFKLPH